MAAVSYIFAPTRSKTHSNRIAFPASGKQVCKSELYRANICLLTYKSSQSRAARAKAEPRWLASFSFLLVRSVPSSGESLKNIFHTVHAPGTIDMFCPKTNRTHPPAGWMPLNGKGSVPLAYYFHYLLTCRKVVGLPPGFVCTNSAVNTNYTKLSK